MNKKQRQILMKKILPIALILVLVIVGLVSIPIIRSYGDQIEKENKEWYSDPANKEKIENAIIESNEKEDEEAVIQNSNLRLINSLKIEFKGWKVVGEYNDEKAGMLQLTNQDDYFNILYNVSDNYIGLKDYSEIQNEKIKRNLEKQGLILNSTNSVERVIKERYAFIEIYETKFQDEKKPDMVVMSVKHKNYYYTISYPSGSDEVSKLFDNFSFVD